MIRPIAVVRPELRKSGILVGELREGIRQTDAGVRIVKTRRENLDLIAKRSIASLRAVRPKVGVVKKDSARSSNRHAAIAGRIQSESQARRKMPPGVVVIFVCPSILAPPTGSTQRGKLKASRGVDVHLTMYARVKRRSVKMRRLVIGFVPR